MTYRRSPPPVSCWASHPHSAGFRLIAPVASSNAGDWCCRGEYMSPHPSDCAQNATPRRRVHDPCWSGRARVQRADRTACRRPPRSLRRSHDPTRCAQGLMMRRVLVAVGNDVIEDFVKRDVQRENVRVGELVPGGEVVDHIRHPRDLGQVVVDPDFTGCRQPGLRWHRGSSIHRCDKALGDYSTHYSHLRGVRHRRKAFFCGTAHRRGGRH